MFTILSILINAIINIKEKTSSIYKEQEERLTTTEDTVENKNESEIYLEALSE